MVDQTQTSILLRVVPTDVVHAILLHPGAIRRMAS